MLIIIVQVVVLKEAVAPKRKRCGYLNSILNANKRAQQADGILTTAFSYVYWSDISSVFTDITTVPKPIFSEDIDSLH